MVEALGTIARSGTKAFVERLEAARTKASGEGATLIGQFGVGFYSAFMVADRVDVISRRAGSDEAWRWSSDGKGTFTVGAGRARRGAGARHPRRPPSDGRRQGLHRALQDRAHRHGASPATCRCRSRSSRSPARSPPRSPTARRSGPSRASEISAADYTDFYRSVADQFDEPALTVHFRAEGRHEFTTLVFVPSSRPFDLYDPDRKGRIKLYVKRVFITDDAEILPRYLRFVRGLVDSADLPLNLSREMIQQSPLLAAIKKSVTGRVLSDLEKLADSDAEAYGKIWDVLRRRAQGGHLRGLRAARRAA